LDLYCRIKANQMSIIRHLRFSLFLFLKLPAAWWSGLKLADISETTSKVSISHNWRTKNPFGSMYFACQAMAAEMASGILAFNAVNRANGSYSMFVKNMEVEFTKKAKGKITFTCEDGSRIIRLLESLQQSGESGSLKCTSTGMDQSGDLVSRFVIEWHFRRKN